MLQKLAIIFSNDFAVLVNTLQNDLKISKHVTTSETNTELYVLSLLCAYNNVPCTLCKLVFLMLLFYSFVCLF